MRVPGNQIDPGVIDRGTLKTVTRQPIENNRLTEVSGDFGVARTLADFGIQFDILFLSVPIGYQIVPSPLGAAFERPASVLRLSALRRLRRQRTSSRRPLEALARRQRGRAGVIQSCR